MTKRPSTYPTYNPLVIPTHRPWQLTTRIPRVLVPQVCEQLHSIMHERRGASFYYPDFASRTTTIRYEWNRRWKNQQYGLRLGLFLRVSDDDLLAIHAYAADGRQSTDPPSAPPSVSPALEGTLKKEFVRTVQQALDRAKPEAQSSRYPVFHISVPHNLGVDQAFIAKDGSVAIFPTRLLPDMTRVSAVSFCISAASNELAKSTGLRVATLLCALLTLASNQPYTITPLQWPKRRGKIEYLESFEAANIDRLYPLTKHPPPRNRGAAIVGQRLQRMLDCFNALSDADRSCFVQSLYAYFSAEETWHKHPTLATVAYVAAAAVLAKPLQKQCDGKLSCTKCGPISFQHNITGDAAAVRKLAAELCGFTGKPAKQKQLNDLIQRVYSRHRSAFVHEAVFRHGEHDRRADLPSALPSTTDHVSDLYHFESDFHSFRYITRRLLLEWLAQRSGIALDYDLLAVDKGLVLVRSNMMMNITVTKRGVEIAMPQRPKPE